MDRNSTAYIFGFAALVCVVASVAVSGVSIGLRDRQELNRLRDKRASILQALKLADSNLKGEAIDKMWSERIEERFLTPTGETAEGESFDQDGDGDLDSDDVTISLESAKRSGKKPKVMSVFVRKDGDEIGAIAVPMTGTGLWGPLGGYLAVNPSGTGLVGSTFFAPKETPGLGAEITETSFEAKWEGKKIVDIASKARTVRVVKGTAAQICSNEVEHCVDGISGATITSDGVDDMVAQSLSWYRPYLNRLHGVN